MTATAHLLEQIVQLGATPRDEAAYLGVRSAEVVGDVARERCDSGDIVGVGIQNATVPLGVSQRRTIDDSEYAVGTPPAVKTGVDQYASLT